MPRSSGRAHSARCTARNIPGLRGRAGAACVLVCGERCLAGGAALPVHVGQLQGPHLVHPVHGDPAGQDGLVARAAELLLGGAGPVGLQGRVKHGLQGGHAGQLERWSGGGQCIEVHAGQQGLVQGAARRSRGGREGVGPRPLGVLQAAVGGRAVAHRGRVHRGRPPLLAHEGLQGGLFAGLAEGGLQGPQGGRGRQVGGILAASEAAAQGLRGRHHHFLRRGH
mmetsp:Transcript_19295/g.26393  ORF Transcript_19295/g.26393 Transcript_19295/m.26393 type:complete len:224 (-) Transcript_19295:313-984(-)